MDVKLDVIFSTSTRTSLPFLVCPLLFMRNLSPDSQSSSVTLFRTSSPPVFLPPPPPSSSSLHRILRGRQSVDDDGIALVAVLE